jgi:SAM-dependent methyltransferase
MQYAELKNSLGNIISKHPVFRILFYKVLDLLILRSWHIKREINRWENKCECKTLILDAGSGFGQYAYYLSAKNKLWNVLGVDINEELVSDCNTFFLKLKKTNGIFKTADLRSFVKENTFDLILSVDVMEHIVEDEQVFANFYQSLKPGAMLLLSTPKEKSGKDRLKNSDDAMVRNGYDPKEIEDKLKRVGFSRVNVLYAYGPSGKLSWYLSIKIPLIIFNTSKWLFLLMPIYYLFVFPVCMVLNYLDVMRLHRSGDGLIVKAWK